MMGFGQLFSWRAAGAIPATAALILLAAGCDSNSRTSRTEDRKSLIAMVNDSPITLKDIRSSLMARDGGGSVLGKDESLGRALVEKLVERRLILQRSREIGEFIEEARVQALIRLVSRQYGSREEMDKILRDEGINRALWEKSIREMLEMEQVLNREVYSKINLPEDVIRNYYNNLLPEFRVGKRWRVRQIVVRTEEMAKRLRAKIVSGVPFGLLARQTSIGPRRHRGGDMGLFSSGQFPDRVQKVVQSLKGGEVSQVVQTSSGFHLFEVTERRSAGIQPFRAVREKIRRKLLAERGREKLRKWISALKEKADIRYYWRNLNDRAAG
jgi:parvulin-like peptidyl-prolyl isomerase